MGPIVLEQLPGLWNILGTKPSVYEEIFSSFQAERQSNHQDLWSGRWESNPRPKLGKLLYCHCTTPALLATRRLYLSPSSLVQTVITRTWPREPLAIRGGNGRDDGDKRPSRTPSRNWRPEES